MEKSRRWPALACAVLLSLLLSGCPGDPSAPSTSTAGAGSGGGTGGSGGGSGGSGGGSGGGTSAPPPTTGVAAGPADFLLGKRLFRDTRFGHFYAVNSNGNVNTTLRSGDPVVDDEVNFTGNPPTLPDPMRGKSINCMQCHLGAEDAGVTGGGNRAFSDFATHSPVPTRQDDPAQQFTTARNAQPLVGNNLHGSMDTVLHTDGQFGSMQDLVVGTLTGRNFGWLATEQAQALHQVASVIRGDNGRNELASEFSGGVTYRDLFDCSNSVPQQYQLPKQDCLDVGNASDAQVVAQVGLVMTSYLNGLHFHKDSSGQYDGSPYDQFLIANGLPRSPAPGQSAKDYAANLFRQLQGLNNPTFVNRGNFKYHDQRPFVFGAHELNGLMEFLRRPKGKVITQQEADTNVIGNCVACHAPPDFTDFMMHNTGATQFEYEDINGQGTFANLFVPDLDTRNTNPDAFLPVTPQHPFAQEPYRKPADVNNPNQTDLGAWNIFANPDFPERQASLRKYLCAIDSGKFQDCGKSDSELLDRSLGVFRTHTLRDLGDSAPYLHSGHFKTLEDVVMFYHHAGEFARGEDGNSLRNPDPQIQNIALDHPELPDLILFLQSLDEDYQEP